MTDTDSGEVAVRENGSVTVLGADSLEDSIWVDLDESTPSVRVPADTDVSFNDPDGPAATDGGERATERMRIIDSRGWSLSSSTADFALGLGGLALIATGWLAGSDGNGIVGMLLLVFGIAAMYVGARSKWSGTRVADSDVSDD